MEQNYGQHVKGLVEDTLGSNGKPVFRTIGSPRALDSAASFSQWYAEVPSVNQKFEVSIPIQKSPSRPGLYVYDSDVFSPRGFWVADGRGFGNTPGQAHNFHFTTEIHSADSAWRNGVTPHRLQKPPGPPEAFARTLRRKVDVGLVGNGSTVTASSIGLHVASTFLQRNYRTHCGQVWSEIAGMFLHTVETSARLLGLLAMLPARRHWTGPALAAP
jgi:hypothetical protein